MVILPYHYQGSEATPKVFILILSTLILLISQCYSGTGPVPLRRTPTTVPQSLARSAVGYRKEGVWGSYKTHPLQGWDTWTPPRAPQGNIAW